jgi:uncharacterized protein
MKKVFIIHGFEGSPNGGWRPWLMGELEKRDIYACSLAMPKPDAPVLEEWVAEIARHVSAEDEVYLVGHSLGGPAILRYLERPDAAPVAGAVLVAAPSEKNGNRKIDGFLEGLFDFDAIRSRCPKFAVIHGDTDPNVPTANAEFLARELGAELTWVKNGGHLNGSAGWFELPQCLEAVEILMGA